MSLRTLFIFFITLPHLSIAQHKFQYLSPVPNSSLVSPRTNIIIRYGDPIDGTTVTNSSVIEVLGSTSGQHLGRLTLTSGEKTLIFTPERLFSPAETVSVTLSDGVTTQSGISAGELRFSFVISKPVPQPSIDAMILAADGILLPSQHSSSGLNSSKGINKKKIASANFPASEVLNTTDPSPGMVFFCPLTGYSNDPYLFILGNDGQPRFYRKMSALCFDFKVQPTGILTYYDYSTACFLAMDSTYAVVDTFRTGNGYTADLHELRVLPNHHAFLMSYDFEPVAMDTVVQNGNPQASVGGLIIQEIDENKNVIFQWRSWDHFKITDATHEDLTASRIDYVHGNAIEIDNDGNLLLSSRHLDEITKIDRQTGEIIWRLGGKNNQFTFVNDPLGFSHQHAIRRLPNGDITLFDNGNFHSPQFSRAVEYQLDEKNKIATLVWQYRNDPDIFSYAMGYVQRLSDNNTMIGWGAGSPSVSEVSRTNTKVFELEIPNASYRSYRLPWRDAILRVDTDTLGFGNLVVSDSTVRRVTVHNISRQIRTITSLVTRDPRFSVLTPAPIDLGPADSAVISILFKPDSLKSFEDALEIHSDGNSEGIMEEVFLRGSGNTFTPMADENAVQPKEYELGQNYPNPFNPSTTIRYGLPLPSHVRLTLFNMLGQSIAQLLDADQQAGWYQQVWTADVASGIYFYRLEASATSDPTKRFVQVRKMILLR